MADAQPSNITAADSSVPGIVDSAFEVGLAKALRNDKRRLKRRERAAAKRAADDAVAAAQAAAAQATTPSVQQPVPTTVPLTAEQIGQIVAEKVNEAFDQRAAAVPDPATQPASAPTLPAPPDAPVLTADQIREQQEIEEKRKHWMDLDHWNQLFPGQQPAAVRGNDHIKIVLPGVNGHALQDFGDRILAKPDSNLSDPNFVPDPRAIVMMVASAKARGWKSISFTGGNDTFKLYVALEAERQGIPMSAAYKPPANLSAEELQKVRANWHSAVGEMVARAQSQGAGIAETPAADAAVDPAKAEAERTLIREVVSNVSAFKASGGDTLDIAQIPRDHDVVKPYYWAEGRRQGLSVTGYVPENIQSLPVPKQGRFGFGQKKKQELYAQQRGQLEQGHLDLWKQHIQTFLPAAEASAILTPPVSAPAPSPAPATVSSPSLPPAEALAAYFTNIVEAIADVEKKTPPEIISAIKAEVALHADAGKKTLDLSKLDIDTVKLQDLAQDLELICKAEAMRTGLTIEGVAPKPQLETLLSAAWTKAMEAMEPVVVAPAPAPAVLTRQAANRRVEPVMETLANPGPAAPPAVSRSVAGAQGGRGLQADPKDRYSRSRGLGR